MKSQHEEQQQQQTQILYEKTHELTINYRSSGSPTIQMAGNNTFILHTYNMQHITSENVLLKELALDGVTNVWGKWVIKQNIFVMWVKVNQEKDHELWQWNLEDGSCMKLKINRKLAQQSIINVLAFQDTALMCVIESLQTSQFQSKQSLEYYQFPQKTGIDKPCQAYNFDMGDWSRMKTPIKLNRHSGIVWVQEQLQLETCNIIWVFDLRNTGERKGKINFYSFRQVMNQNAQIYDMELRDIWEPEKGKIYLKYFMTLSYQKYTRSSKQKQPSQALKDLQGVYEVIWNYQQNTHYVPKFAKRSQHAIQFLGNLRKVRRFYIPYKGFRPPMMMPAQKSLRMPIYYVDFRNQEVMGSELASSYQYTPFEIDAIYNFSYPEYSTDFILQSAKLEPKELFPRMKVLVTKIQLLPYRGQIISAFLIQEILPNSDEDLLDQAINLIEFKHGLDGYQPKNKVIQPIVRRVQKDK